MYGKLSENQGAWNNHSAFFLMGWVRNFERALLGSLFLLQVVASGAGRSTLGDFFSHVSGVLFLLDLPLSVQHLVSQNLLVRNDFLIAWCVSGQWCSLHGIWPPGGRCGGYQKVEGSSWDQHSITPAICYCSKQSQSKGPPTFRGWKLNPTSIWDTERVCGKATMQKSTWDRWSSCSHCLKMQSPPP